MMSTTDSPSTADERRPAPQPRRPDLPFGGSPIPRYWFGGSALATHLANGLNLLFPDGERLFVKSVRYYRDAIAEDPMLRREVEGFFGQEGSHAREHQRFFEILREQGYPIDDLLTDFRRSLRALEKLPPAFQLAGTAAAEHFTATMAHHALSRQDLEHAHPTVRHLLMWHAAEEIEHKAVAFDVLQKVEPSYLVRVAGLALASMVLGYWWYRATRMLLRHDGLGRAEVRRERELLAETRSEGDEGIARGVFLKGIVEYLRPGFHPWQVDDLHLAERYLGEHGMA